MEKENLEIIVFSAKWCGPCKALKPKLKNVSENFKDAVSIKIVDIEEDDDLVSKHKIRSVPTMLFFKNEKIVGSIQGNVSYQVIEEEIKKSL
jgi:thioredoxin 1